MSENREIVISAFEGIDSDPTSKQFDGRASSGIDPGINGTYNARVLRVEGGYLPPRGVAA